MLRVAIAIDDSHINGSIQELMSSVQDVQPVSWGGIPSVGSSLGAGQPPEIIIMDDGADEERMLAGLTTLREGFPDAAFFVVSLNSDPRHIIKIMKAGGTEYFLIPVSPQDFTRAIAEVRQKLASPGRTGRGAVYSFISSKGGLGATVLTVNTAAAMTMNGGGEVALCDTALQAGDSSVLLDLVPENTISDLCRNFHRLDYSLLRSAMIKHSCGLQLLAAPLRPEESEEISQDHLAKIIDLLAQHWDNVFIDCTSMFLHPHSITVFNASTRIFVVTDLSVPALRNAARMHRLLTKLGINDRKIEFVVNRFQKSSVFQIEEAQKSLGKKFFWLFPNQFEDIASSINEGVPVVQSHPRSAFSKNITEFARKLHDPEKHNGYRGVRAMFGRAI